MDASVYVRALLLPQSYQYPNLSEGADRVGGLLRGDKECPFSGVTKSGRIWRKVPESDARSVHEPRKGLKREVKLRGSHSEFPVRMPDPIRKRFGYGQLWPLRPVMAITASVQPESGRIAYA